MSVFERLSAAAASAAGITAADAAWYLGGASVLWLAFYVVFRRAARSRKVVPRDPTAGQVRAEVLRSLRSLAVFGLVAVAIRYAALAGYTRLYWRVDEHGWAWFFGSVAVAIVLHDAYFYWSHRLLHHPALFRRVHRTHHLSANPTPWAAYSFGIWEAFVQAGIGPVVVCLIPIHPGAFALFMAWQVGFNVFGHCGFEIFPGWFLRTPAGKFLNTPTHHALHHEAVRGNYGLYFNVWDRLLGTNHCDYQERFELVTAGRPRGLPERELAGSAERQLP
jgi:sterol desaturase/sphingolipid hydroxylase (fatty acid hydroxylase superfamily)